MNCVSAFGTQLKPPGSGSANQRYRPPDYSPLPLPKMARTEAQVQIGIDPVLSHADRRSTRVNSLRGKRCEASVNHVESAPPGRRPKKVKGGVKDEVIARFQTRERGASVVYLTVRGRPVRRHRSASSQAPLQIYTNVNPSFAGRWNGILARGGAVSRSLKSCTVHTPWRDL